MSRGQFSLVICTLFWCYIVVSATSAEMPLIRRNLPLVNTPITFFFFLVGNVGLKVVIITNHEPIQIISSSHSLSRSRTQSPEGWSGGLHS